MKCFLRLLFFAVPTITKDMGQNSFSFPPSHLARALQCQQLPKSFPGKDAENI